MSNEFDDAQYEQKYLKYKAKYLALKKEYDAQGGALFAKTGVAAIVSSADRINKMKARFDKGDAPSRFSLDQENDREAYIVYNGEDYMKLMESSTRQFSDKASDVAAKASEAASQAAAKASAYASQASVKAKELASQASKSASSMYDKTKLAIQSAMKKTGGSASSAQKISLGAKFDHFNKDHRMLVKKLALEQGVSADLMIVIAFNRFGSNQLITIHDLSKDV